MSRIHGDAVLLAAPQAYAADGPRRHSDPCAHAWTAARAAAREPGAALSFSGLVDGADGKSVGRDGRRGALAQQLSGQSDSGDPRAGLYHADRAYSIPG